MADISRSVFLSKKLSIAGDVTSRHMYDGVFSDLTSTKFNASPFSLPVVDYTEIFSPSEASLGSSIPILDLPAVDQSTVVARTRNSRVDYAGVFGGLGDDDRIGVPAEELFRELRKNAKTDAQRSRSSAQLKIPASKSQEFIHDSGNHQESKSPAKSKMSLSKSQEFCGTSLDNSESTCQNSESAEHVNVSQQKTNQLSNDGTSGMTHLPHLNAASKSAPKTRTTLSKSQEFCGSSGENQASSNALNQQSHDVNHVDVSHQQTNQLSEDDAAEMTQLNTKTTVFDEVGPPRKTGLDKAKRMSMDDADFNVNVGKGKRQGKHARAVSDLGTDKQTNDHDAQLQKEFGGGECHKFDATRSTRKSNLKSQTFSVSSLSSLPQLYETNDYFRRSSIQRSKSSSNNQQHRAAAGSSSALLEEELDENSAAAVSAAAMKRVIEEAEAMIWRAKEFLKRQEGDCSTKMTFKDSLKVKTTSNSTCDFDEASELKQNSTLEVEDRRQNKEIDEDKVLIRKSHLNTNATSENTNINIAGGLKSKDDLKFRATTESQVADEAGVLNEKVHGVAAQEYTTTKDCVGFKGTSPAETFGETHDSLDQADYINDAELKVTTNSHVAPKSTKQRHKYKGGGEWEAAKHINKIFSGAKNKFVSFISKKADTEKIVIQEEISTTSRSVDQSNGSTSLVQDAETHIKWASDQDHVEKVVKMNSYASSGVGEIAQDSDRIGMVIHRPEENEVKRTVTLEQGKVDDITASPDAEMLINQQCDASEVQEPIEVKRELIQEAVQDQVQEILDDIGGCGHEKGQLGNNEQIEHDMEQEATYQSSGYDLEEDTHCKVHSEPAEVEQDQKAVVGGDESLDGKDETWRQKDLHSSRETELPELSRKKLEDVEMVEETRTDELQERVLEENLDTREDKNTIEQQGAVSKLTIGLIEVAEDTSEHDKYFVVAHDVSGNESKQYDQHLESSSGGGERMAEPPSSSFESKMNVEPPISLQIGTQLVREDICEQQEQSSLKRNEEARGCDDTDQYPQFVDFNTSEKERMADSSNTTSENKGSLEQPISVNTVNDLIGKEMYEQAGCSTELADETLNHEEFPTPADFCNKEVQSCFNGNSEGYAHDDRNENAQNVKFAFDDERMTDSTTITSEPERNAEHPSYAQEVMTETSTSGRDCEDIDLVEEEIEETCEILAHTNIKKIQCETDSNTEQKHANEEAFATEIDSEKQDDDLEGRMDTVKVDINSDMDTIVHGAEISYKRKRWFQRRDEVGELHWSGVLPGDEISLELDQENSLGSKVDDRVEIHVDDMVNEAVEGTNVQQTNASSSMEDGHHSTESTHRRRRWFEDTAEELLHKPSIFDGAGLNTPMDDQFAQESELDDSLRNCANKSVNEGKESTDLADDQEENRATTEAAHRRRRWFENGEGVGLAQRPSILEDDGVKVGGEAEMGKEKHDELGETSTSSTIENKPQNQATSREREKERERIVVDRAIREARQRAFAEAREKVSMDAKLKMERAAVERATAEARERALQRALSEKTPYKSKEKDPRNQPSGSSYNSGYSSVPSTPEKSSGGMTESPESRKVVSEKNRRIMERAAKALEEKNNRDFLVEKEQAERNRFADALDADVKRWLAGKEGNLRAILATLQYILSPDSGWQPIPLADLDTSTAVRKAYKKAALCVHPDKLQQRGATIQQKYICEKVFDILKDAWNRFNPDDW